MVETVSREELKLKMDGGESFVLVETLQEVAYRHEHLPAAINLPPDRVRELAPRLLPDRGRRSSSTVLHRRDMPRRTPPGSWRPWGMRTSRIMPAGSPTGSRRGCRRRVTTDIRRGREVKNVEATRVTVDEVKERMERGEQFAFVDTRNPQAWGEADTKLPGAVRVAADELDAHLAEIPRDRAVITYCT